MSKSQMPSVGVVVLCVGFVFGGFWAYARFSDRKPTEVAPTPQSQMVNTQTPGPFDSQNNVDASNEVAPQSADNVNSLDQPQISPDTNTSTAQNSDTSVQDDNEYPNNVVSNDTSSDVNPTDASPRYEYQPPTKYELYNLASDFVENRVRFNEKALGKTIVTSGEFLSAETFYDDILGVERIAITIAFDAYHPEEYPRFAVFGIKAGLLDSKISKLRKGKRITVYGTYAYQSQRIHLSTGTVEVPGFALADFD